jgi:hypothetical protein
MMKNQMLLRSFLLVACALSSEATKASQAEPYTYSTDADGALVVHRLGVPPQRFLPRFLVLHSSHDPKLAMRPGQIGKLKYNVASWIAGPGKRRGGLAEVDTSVTAGDGHDVRILRGDTQGRTADYFSAASVSEWVASNTRRIGDTVVWTFPKSNLGKLSARIDLSSEGPPILSFRFSAKRPGNYSIGYAGAPSMDFSEVTEIWQPLVWQGKRFPEQSYLTLAYRCTLPAPMVSHDGVTVSIVASPEELPFDPLPVDSNSGFGIAVRNERGQAQPLIFAPVLGGRGSRMGDGDKHYFRMLLWVGPDTTTANYEEIARTVYGFHDFRTNALGSLNETLQNMIAYGLSKHSQFNEELRGCSYATDVPGAVKNVSSLHPLSAALVTDNPEIYHRRVQPIIEYMLSREKFLFAVGPDVKIQNPSWRLKGPCAPTSELAALFSMSARANPYLLELATELLNSDRTLNLDTPIGARRWDDVMAVAQASDDDILMKEAVKRAQHYVQHETTTTSGDFKKQGAAFWDQLVPRFPELLTLYEATGDARWLDTAHEAARAYCQFIWMVPEIPDSSLLVNAEGKAPHYYYLRSKGHPQMNAAPERVEAWRLSEIGLAPEGPPTSTGHRGVFLATHAPWMMRIGALTDDAFLQEIARSAIVGRYRNFPGYHMNTARTTIYEKADYPLRDHHELSFNSFHYNHIWPHIALLIDYLVSDVFAKSEGAIDFPSQFAEGYAYLKNRIYGDRPGHFYGDAGVWLWMPKELVEIDNPELNYLTARKGDTLYIALANQSPQAEQATFNFKSDLAKISDDASVRAWTNNVSKRNLLPKNGAITVEVPSSGDRRCRHARATSLPPDIQSTKDS